ncbi:hypothetical protein [Deinococcus aerophilus]|uniref:Uncharacterized protein n=1 Tax=Deinococcus aerophilus TaxID=522488 RepID=A0ABQ2GR33_9DEIO|nr:hypothetical protein [Deinococcus aerophilus]GGM08987.1 hypothetical protein GCM10010841_16760 [Deinococcus aerophilus]
MESQLTPHLWLLPVIIAQAVLIPLGLAFRIALVLGQLIERVFGYQP